MAKYEIDTLLELSKASSKAPQVVEDFVVQFQAVADLLAARQAKKAKRKLPKEVTDEDGWTSFVKHTEENTEEGGENAAPVEAEVVEEDTKKKSASKPQMKVKTSASKMTRSGNGGGEAVVAINQTKAFNAFAALGGDDDDDDE